MACPPVETMRFWPASLWSTPLNAFQVGAIPVLWTTGRLPNEAGGDSDIWLGRRVPDTFEWFGNSIIMVYNSGAYERGMCMMTMPRIKVLIQGFCRWGLNNLHIDIQVGKRRYSHHLVAFNGNDGTFHGRPRFGNKCGYRYANPSRQFQINIKTIYHWVRLCREYCLNTFGVIGPWWSEAQELLAGSTSKFEPCDGCEYGFLESPKGVQLDTWADLQLAVFPYAEFPLRRNSGKVRVSMGCPDRVALIVDTATGDADRYAKLPLDCLDVDTYARSELFISSECFLPDPKTWPEPNDVRWAPRCLPSKSCTNAGLAYASSATNVTVGIPFSIESTVYPNPAPSASMPGLKYVSTGPNTRVVLAMRWAMAYQRVQERVELENGLCQVIVTQNMKMVKDFFHQPWIHEALGTDGLWRFYKYDENENSYAQQWTAYARSLDKAAAEGGCNPMWPDFDGGFAPPPPEPQGDGNCYIEGSITATFGIEVFKYGSVGVKLNLKAGIPFRFKVPNRTSSMGNVTFSTPNGRLVASTGYGSVSVDLNLVLKGVGIVANYLIDATPARFLGIENLRVLCE